MPSISELVIAPIGTPPYSVRGVSETLAQIEQSAQLERGANGGLVDMSNPVLRKYRVSLECEDMNSPALDGMWPGAEVTIDCISELGYLTAGGSPERPIVSGSSRVVEDWTYYRPQLTCVVITPWEQTTLEAPGTVSWRMELEEV